MNDLFDKRNAKEKLLAWASEKQYIRTSEVIAWGSKNFSNRALRNMQQLAQDGLFVRLTDEEKLREFGCIKEDVWRSV